MIATATYKCDKFWTGPGHKMAVFSMFWAVLGHETGAFTMFGAALGHKSVVFQKCLSLSFFACISQFDEAAMVNDTIVAQSMLR